MDDRISKNIHRELRTMNGKLDEMGVVSRILTDSIKEQTAGLKQNAKQKTPKLEGLTFPSATSDSITFSKLNMMFVSLQRQVASLRVSPLITISTNVDSSSSNRVTIENTNELASSIAQQLSASLPQQLAAALASTLGKCSSTDNDKSEKKGDKSKSWLDRINDAYEGFKKVNDEVTTFRDLSENIKFVKEVGSKIKNKWGGSKSDGKSEGSGGGKEDSQKDLGQAANGAKNEGDTKDKGNPSNKGKEKENSVDSLKSAANGSNKDKNSLPNSAKPNNSKSPPTNTGTDANQKSSPKPTSNTQQDLANAATGSNGEGQAPSPKDIKVESSKPSTAPKKRWGAGILGKAKKLGKWGSFFAGGAGLAMGLFGGKKDEDGEKSESAANDSSNVVQATAETVQSVQTSVGTMADAANTASTVSNAGKAAKKVGWLGKLLKGARAVSKATKFLRFTPAGFLGGLAVDAGLWAAEKFLLPKDEENQDNEKLEEDKQNSLPMVRANIIEKNRMLAASTVTSSVQPYSTNLVSPQPMVDSPSIGTMTPASSNQPLHMPGTGPTANGSMEVSANSNVTMNLNVTGYIDNRMIEEIKRIAREQYDASFRSFQRSIEGKLPKPKPFPRPQVAEGGMMSY